MKTVVFCNHSLIIPLLTHLENNDNLLAVITPSQNRSQLDEIHLFCTLKHIPLLNYAHGTQDNLIQQLQTLQPDLGVVFTFPFILPESVFTIPQHGSWNLHGSPLPLYRGPDPIFWQLKHGAQAALTLCLHQIVSQPDEGDIFDTQSTDLHDDDTKGTCMSKLAQLAVPLVTRLQQQLKTPKSMKLLPQGKSRASYQPRPTPEDFTIQWDTMSASSIRNLVRATNPDYSGAITWLRGSEVKIIEVDAFSSDTPVPGAPGCCIDSADDDPNLYVVCVEQSFIRINVAASVNIISSGVTLKKIFNIQSGERFSSTQFS